MCINNSVLVSPIACVIHSVGRFYYKMQEREREEKEKKRKHFRRMSPLGSLKLVGDFLVLFVQAASPEGLLREQ